MENVINAFKQYSFVIDQISYKESKRKTDDTNFGLLWNILNPLLYMVILSSYYQNIVIHDDIDRFPVFIFIGITIKHFYDNATIGAMHSLVDNKNFLTKTQLPIDVFVNQKIFMAIKELLYSSIALIPILFYFKVRIHLRILNLIPIMIITTILVAGLGKILAVLFVYFADIAYFYQILSLMIFFVSGAFLPMDRMPASFQPVLAYNPVFLSIYLARNSIMYNLPSHWTAWVKLIVWAILFYGFGTYLFSKKKNVIIGHL